MKDIIVMEVIEYQGHISNVLIQIIVLIIKYVLKGIIVRVVVLIRDNVYQDIIKIKLNKYSVKNVLKDTIVKILLQKILSFAQLVNIVLQEV